MKLSCQERLIPGKSYAEKLSFLEHTGFEGIEVHGRDLESRLPELETALKQTKVRVSTICAGFGGCLLDPNIQERNKAVNDIKKMLEIAGKLNCIGLIVVPIFGPPRLPDISPLKQARQLEEELITMLLSELAESAWKNSTRILIEPLNRYETHFINTAEQALKICKKVDHAGLKIMLDTFHMNIEEQSMATAIEIVDGNLLHVHLADSNRTLPGYGHTNFKSAFDSLKKIGYQEFLAFEVKTHAPAGVDITPEEALKKTVKYLQNFM